MSTASAETQHTLHSHRCMRCDGVFTCKTPEMCAAQYDVLPNIVTLVNGRPHVSEHCPIGTTHERHRVLTNAVDSILRGANEEDFVNPERYNAMVERIVNASLFAFAAAPAAGPR